MADRAADYEDDVEPSFKSRATEFARAAMPYAVPALAIAAVLTLGTALVVSAPLLALLAMTAKVIGVVVAAAAIYSVAKADRAAVKAMAKDGEIDEESDKYKSLSPYERYLLRIEQDKRAKDLAKDWKKVKTGNIDVYESNCESAKKSFSRLSGAVVYGIGGIGALTAMMAIGGITLATVSMPALLVGALIMGAAFFIHKVVTAKYNEHADNKLEENKADYRSARRRIETAQIDEAIADHQTVVDDIDREIARAERRRDKLESEAKGLSGGDRLDEIDAELREIELQIGKKTDKEPKGTLRDQKKEADGKMSMLHQDREIAANGSAEVEVTVRDASGNERKETRTVTEMQTAEGKRALESTVATVDDDNSSDLVGNEWTDRLEKADRERMGPVGKFTRGVLAAAWDGAQKVGHAATANYWTDENRAKRLARTESENERLRNLNATA